MSENADLYRERIMWKIGMHGIIGAGCRDLTAPAERARREQLVRRGVTGEPLLLFGELEGNWTAVSTSTVMGEIDGEARSCDVESIVFSLPVVKADASDKATTTRVGVEALDGECEFWAPPGSPVFALSSVISVLPRLTGNARYQDARRTAFVDVHSLSVGGVELRALRIGPGHWIDVHWPRDHREPAERALNAFLSDRTGVAARHVRVTASVAAPHLVARRRFPWIRDVRFGSLRRACSPELLDDWDALGREFGWSAEDRPSHSPGTPKVLIAVLLAMSKSRLVAFSTAGLDPLGVSRVERLVDDARDRGWAFLQHSSGAQDSEVSVRRR